MKKILSFSVLALCFTAVSAGAQTYQILEIVALGMPQMRPDYYQRMVRPYRDRSERFQSARTEALQMSLAVGDESNRLTLEGWGDNRADIRGGSSRMQLEYGPLFGDTYDNSGNKNGNYPGDRAGFYGRFGTVELEASRLEQKEDPVPSAPGDKYSETSAGGAFSFGTGGVRLGFHGNVKKGEHTDANNETNNTSVGGALALKAGLFELGATADLVARDYSEDNYDENRSGPMLGAQGIIRLPGGLTGGLRASMAKLSGEVNDNGVNTDLEGNNNELGARAEWAFPVVPLTVAASYEKMYMDPEYKGGGTTDRVETDIAVKTLGAAFKPFGGRLLLGAELKDLNIEYDQTTNGSPAGSAKTESNTVTFGAEVWLLPGFALRASKQRLEIKDGLFGSGDELLYNVYAAGAGLKGEHFNLDASFRVFEEDDNGGSRDKFEELRLMYGYRF